MSRQNKKDSVAMLHKDTIINAAEILFLNKGVSSTTIEDISKASEYSRRTIYAYFDSKEDILHHIVLKGLEKLKEALIYAISNHKDFIDGYKAICKAMQEYQYKTPQSAESVNKMKVEDIDYSSISTTMMRIFELGVDINNMLAKYIDDGKNSGIVRSNVDSLKTVYIMWGCISSLHTLVETKNVMLEKEFLISQENFLEYGYKQIINSILEESKRWE